MRGSGAAWGMLKELVERIGHASVFLVFMSTIGLAGALVMVAGFAKSGWTPRDQEAFMAYCIVSVICALLAIALKK